MSSLSGKDRTRYVRQIFGQIAPRYDRLNRLMTAGQDLRWRREAIQQLEISPGMLILDAGAGTGDITLMIMQCCPQVRVIASDLTPEMIQVGKNRPGGSRVTWVVADANDLPFASGIFDGAISGYLLRNVGDLAATLSEQYRILRPAGRMVSLDTTPPQQNMLKPFINFYLRYGIPLLGHLFAANAEAYLYLPDSTEHFLGAEKLAEKMRSAGFSVVSFVRRMFGTMAIHKAIK
jgi:demethylmenaquinone methyltransferase/2-methoxy-6-polyprenyl-1,4-benzoquinol methylase